MGTDISSVGKVLPDRIAFKPEAGGAAVKLENNFPVGYFDSGVGGLTVFAEFVRQLPSEDVIYFADTAHVPYGGRSAEEILKINEQILCYFMERGVKMLIIACGTSSSLAYPVLKEKYSLPMVAMIGPGARSAGLAPPGTVRSA